MISDWLINDRMVLAPVITRFMRRVLRSCARTPDLAEGMTYVYQSVFRICVYKLCG